MSSELLAPLDLAFWHLESPSHPLHLGALAHFGPLPVTTGHEPADVLSLLARRAAAVPRLRMRVRDVLLPVGGSAWTADPDFDVRHHVHEIAVPGADFPAETARLAAELMERPVARGLPPWEMYLLSGAPDGSFAVLVKLHHALADGMRAVAIGAGIFDEIAVGRRPANRQRPVPPRSWLPGPGRLLGMARDRIGDLGRAVEVGASVVGASVVRAGRLDGHPALAAESSGTRRIATVTLPLDRVHRVRRTTGGTANDVLLAVVAGALRRWFDGRGLPFPGADPRALVPVSRRRPGTPPGPGNSLSGYLVDLPVTEPDPTARLAAVRTAMDRNKAAGPFRGAGAVALLAD
ncbi:wax ester/triacylglycerol synthase family O-acyltransferase, partial [Streptomyces sp. SR27]|uniref:wax ester/triacylglycerol synthase domain-containing protein n=1 Tax=Streptomyces sp. SR27 TaxID=3076630 RepID=UPI00295B54A8